MGVSGEWCPDVRGRSVSFEVFEGGGSEGGVAGEFGDGGVDFGHGS